MKGLNDQQRNDIIDQLLGNEDELRQEDLSDRIKRKEERIKQGKFVLYPKKNLKKIKTVLNQAWCTFLHFNVFFIRFCRYD